MREIVLRHFLEGHATATELARDVAGTRVTDERPGFRSSANYRVEPMARTFEITTAHVVRLADAVASGALSLEDLGTIVFCLEMAPERWLWDADTPEGGRVSDALFWLGTPEINYPLTPAVLAKVRHYLLTGEATLGQADVALG
jgi:hypothetical protein